MSAPAASKLAVAKHLNVLRPRHLTAVAGRPELQLLAAVQLHLPAGCLLVAQATQPAGAWLPLRAALPPHVQLSWLQARWHRHLSVVCCTWLCSACRSGTLHTACMCTCTHKANKEAVEACADKLRAQADIAHLCGFFPQRQLASAPGRTAGTGLQLRSLSVLAVWLPACAGSHLHQDMHITQNPVICVADVDHCAFVESC